MSSTFATLAAEHEDQIHKYLQFMRAKRDIAMRTIDNEFNDAKSDRLYEDMYSKDDVESIINGLCNVVRANMRQEVGTLVNMTSLLMKQLFESAEEQQATLSMDTSVVEDRALLEEVEKMRPDRAGRGKAAGPNKLVSVKDEHARLMEEKGRLQETNQSLQERFNKVQAECSGILKEKSQLQQEVSTLRQQLRSRAEEKPQAKAEEKAGSPRAADLQRELASLKARLAEAEEENDKRIAESKPFQNLQKMLQTKNEQVSDLRRRLAQFEPDRDDAKYEDA